MDQKNAFQPGQILRLNFRVAQMSPANGQPTYEFLQSPSADMPELSGHDSLFSVHMLFLQRERRIHRITLMLTIRYLNAQANGSLIAPITFTCSLQSCEWWPCWM